jgi:hypothetical protein
VSQGVAYILATTSWFHLSNYNTTSITISFPTPSTANVNAADRTGYEQRNAEQAAAKERATELLMSLLSEDNQRRFRSFLRIRIRGSGGNEYEIARGWQGNVRRSDGARLCAHPNMYCNQTRRGLPAEDAMIAQILMLQTDEAAFLRVANVSL